ncbi:GNAT family N-acetyltransferase [Natrinema salsiterrestre]|uniref:GNAT family N-acetyltransferase n=1 Tax=Natrinema salsiterrestre TaxID=2950540 RepID=A0A9Q4L2Z0_9EURY|nr:GNAT family N-acetyltransferase [Natrinema salsiterrestre]MDF9744386.1 GNAT family N-acetyltransferase [Natrinema salsiterrestre]
MNVRSLESRADVRGIIRAHGLAWRNAYDGLLPAEVLQARSVDPSDDEIDKWVERLRENSDGVLVAVDTSDTVRGFADVRWGSSATKAFVGPNEGELKAIYVAPDRWGRGIGTALLEAGIEALPDSIERLRLEVLADNDVGKRFYEARGFEKTDTSSYDLGGDSYPTRVYTLEI